VACADLWRAEMDDFDRNFNEMMSSAIEYERLKRAGKRIPKRVEERLKRSSEWLNGLSDEDYSRLIH